jgi:hypothetical protein
MEHLDYVIFDYFSGCTPKINIRENLLYRRMESMILEIAAKLKSCLILLH